MIQQELTQNEKKNLKNEEKKYRRAKFWAKVKSVAYNPAYMCFMMALTGLFFIVTGF